ncbi:hypothetical protein F4553_006698 [Allocatelliglobosispora scoriae]|uniref:DUF3307 domain-containing protein n=1 Tax=Allocatelliglobosispora scoriae TaxID=643052 RepID=A0A841BYP8_9ACTN|nr:DUF3307 domain-containing protein [Allocatelliglobosispora scoriae]MBB5873264.1 hypothetical protein [Allocatelliglobosispora scoriae]
MPDTAATFACVFVAFYAAHTVGDHWIQTERQAARKGLPGWAGRRACLAHVATYTATLLAALTAVWLALDLPLTPWRVGLGLAVSAITHYIADRREPLRILARWTGHATFHSLGQPRPGHDDNPSLGTGAYAQDQSWHVAWLFIAALLTATP